MFVLLIDTIFALQLTLSNRSNHLTPRQSYTRDECDCNNRIVNNLQKIALINKSM